MKYEEQLINSIENPDLFIGFENRDSMSILDGIADDSYHKKTTEGYIASAIISHQLTEKILLLLVKYSDALVKARVYPEKIDSSYKNLDAFGKLIERHTTTVVFSRKSRIIKNAVAINEARIQLVHKITEFKDEDDLAELSKKIRDDFENLFNDWLESMAWFYKQFKLLRKRDELKRLFEKYGER